jgi:molecular chaperone DnaK
MTRQRAAVGIDLGTTYSSLAYVDAGNRLQVLRLPDGEFGLASAIYFRGPTDVVVGGEALHYAIVQPQRVARAFKRHMGDPNFRFECDGQAFRPEELSALVLKKLVELAAKEAGPIEEVVIAVPYVFDELRRRATIDAARIAGLRVLDLVDEPVAAALAYGHTLLQGDGLFGHAELNDLFGDSILLVYDLGGGTFDTTVLRLGRDGTFEVLATDGDERLGGEDWDNVLLGMVVEQHRRQAGRDPSEDLGLMQDLRLRVVEAKKALSERPRAEIAYTHDGVSFQCTLALGDFEAKTRHLLERTQATIESMLKGKGMTWKHIDRILLVGGASRMPMVPKLIEVASQRRDLDMSLPPDVAVASGAALYAALRAGGREMRVREVRTVNSHPLGLRVRDKQTMRVINDVLLRANEPTLKKAFRAYRLTSGQAGVTREGVTLSILLGDSREVADCVLLGQGRIAEVPAQTSPEDVVKVTFCFLPNGLLHVAGSYQPAGGGPPFEVEFEVEVEGQMKEEEVRAATGTLRGISIE